MIRLKLSRGESPMRVVLRLPADQEDIAAAICYLDGISTSDPTVIKECLSRIKGLARHIDRNDPDLSKMQLLAERISAMSAKECMIFSAALDQTDAAGIDDVLETAERLGEYLLVQNVYSDADLGRYVAAAGQINADPRFPEEAWEYLDFEKIGAEHRAEHDGFFTAEGYVMRRFAADQTCGATPEQTM